ncbi:MAG TPA: thiamine pyrophosphate-dependent enzyme, partial [Actinomycetota bacterium]
MATEQKTAPRRRGQGGRRAADGFADEKPDTLVDYYRMMWLMRRFEERCAELYQRARIGGYCHLNLGEEATVVGLLAALEPRDYLFTNYREHGYALAKGIEPGRVMAELLGKATGYSKGKGGSMHMFARAKGFYGGHGIVAGQVPLGTGLAFAHKYRGDGGITV